MSRCPQPRRCGAGNGSGIARVIVMTVTQLLVAALAVAGLSTIAGIWAFQTYGIYTFSSAVETPTQFGHSLVRVVRFSSTDGVAVTAWVADPAEGRPVI